MKTIYRLFPALLVAILSLVSTGCKEDTEPRLAIPSEFVLNTPQLADFTYVLSPSTNIDFTLSQPDYGLGVVPVYTFDISLDQNKWETIEGAYTVAKVSISGEAFATAMCALAGYDDPSVFDDAARTVYVRASAAINNCAFSQIYSNIVTLKSVQPYFAVKLPAKLYLVGQPQGWNINSDAMVLSEPENGIGSDIYSGVFEISADDAASGFRFYTALGSWGNDGELPSIGAAANDGDNQSVSVDASGRFEGSCVYGKGNWNLTNWPGGMMKITVDLKGMNVIFEKAL